MDITAETDSCNGFFERPLVIVKCPQFRYVDTGLGHHGIQLDHTLNTHKSEIMKLCSEISDRMLELSTLINK